MVSSGGESRKKTKESRVWERQKIDRSRARASIFGTLIFFLILSNEPRGWLWRCFPSERHKECTDKWQESMVAVVLSCSLRIALLFDMLSPNFDGGALHYNARQHAYHAPRDSDSSRCSHRTTGTYNAEVASSSFAACSRFSIFGTAISPCE